MFDIKLIKKNIKQTYKYDKKTNTLTILDRFWLGYNINCLVKLGFTHNEIKQFLLGGKLNG